MTHWKWLSNPPKKQPSWSAAIEISSSKNTKSNCFLYKMRFSNIENNNKFLNIFF